MSSGWPSRPSGKVESTRRRASAFDFPETWMKSETHYRPGSISVLTFARLNLGRPKVVIANGTFA